MDNGKILTYTSSSVISGDGSLINSGGYNGLPWPEAKRQITAALSQFGFHWNGKRQVWQHPCGPASEGSPDDPRAKYGTIHAADAQPA